jgi:hypothetical protein
MYVAGRFIDKFILHTTCRLLKSFSSLRVAILFTLVEATIISLEKLLVYEAASQYSSQSRSILSQMTLECLCVSANAKKDDHGRAAVAIVCRLRPDRPLNFVCVRRSPISMKRSQGDPFVATQSSPPNTNDTSLRPPMTKCIYCTCTPFSDAIIKFDGIIPK